MTTTGSPESRALAAERLRAFVREQRPGGCRIMSVGSAECLCPLCDIDRLEDRSASDSQEVDRVSPAPTDDVAEWAATYETVFAALANGELAVRPNELRHRIVAALSVDPDTGAVSDDLGRAMLQAQETLETQGPRSVESSLRAPAAPAGQTRSRAGSRQLAPVICPHCTIMNDGQATKCLMLEKPVGAARSDAVPDKGATNG